jgi:phospholipase/carboxylesterase
MSAPGSGPLPPAFATAITQLGAATLGTLQAFEVVQRRLHPPLLPGLRQALVPLRERLDRALDAARGVAVPQALAPFHEQLCLGASHAATAAQLFLEPAPPEEAVPRLLASLSATCRAQEALYPLREALAPVARFFTEPAWHDHLAALDPAQTAPPAGVGIHVASGAEGERGGFHLYVPERYVPERAWPLVVALHGAYGSGADFLWTWLREARSRGFLLLAPTSRGTTWSLQGEDEDAPALADMVRFVAERWNVDAARVCLTGLSDGGTYALLCGLGADSPFTALACVSGGLHPRNVSNGNLGRARGRRIYIAHGALDWLFPAAVARVGRDALMEAGADVTYHEIEDLSHTYPREENDRILRWLDPGLGLPA